MHDAANVRLSVRPLRAEDAAAYYALYEDPAISPAGLPFLDGERPAAFLERIQKLCERHWGIFGDGRLIGDCALHHWNQPAGEMEIGGVLNAGYRGQGIMQWAFRQLHTVAREEYGAKYLIGRTAPENTAAIRLVSGLGYQMTGTVDGEQVLRFEL